MMVYMQKNVCVDGLCVIFIGILMLALKASSTVRVLVVFKGVLVWLQLRW